VKEGAVAIKVIGSITSAAFCRVLHNIDIPADIQKAGAIHTDR